MSPLAESSPSALPPAESVRPDPTPDATPAPPTSGRVARYVVAAPDLTAVALAGLSIGPMVLLLLGHYSVGLVIPLALLGAVAAVVMYRVPARTVRRPDLLYTAAALAVVVGWAVLNCWFSAEDVFATRDPATYDLTARWLMDHHSLVFLTHEEIFGNPANSDTTSAGFGAGPVTGQVYAQGNHLLPALMAVGGWVFGIGGMLKTNVVLSALAMFVVFGLARRTVGSGFALVSMLALAVCLPMLYVGRDSYTEPLAMLFLLGGASLLMHAIHTRRVLDFGLAGLVAGMASAVRIDSYASTLALIVTVVVLVALARPGQRRATCRQVLAFLMAGAAATFLGWIDLTRLSFGYYRDQRSHILLLFYAAALLLILAPGFVALCWSRRGVRLIGSAAVRRRVAGVLGTLVALVTLVLLGRPLWMKTTGSRNISLEGVQGRQGLTPDGTRLYNEHTLEWLALYFGWAALGLGVAGYVILVRRMLIRPRLALLAPLSMGLTMSALYLWTSQITPDQPWAIRRYVPVVIPLLLIAATASLQVVRRRWPRWGPVLAGLGVAAVVGYPLAVSVPVLGIREEVPMLHQVQSICDAVGPDGAVLMLDKSASISYTQTMRSYCHVPTDAVLHPDAGTLREIDAAVTAHGRNLFLLATDAGSFSGALDSGPDIAPYSTVRMQRWPTLINRAPRKASIAQIDAYLATVDDSGRPVAVAPRG